MCQNVAVQCLRMHGCSVTAFVCKWSWFAGMHAQMLASTVLQKLPELSDTERRSMTPLIRALDVHFPEAMDAAVNQLLQMHTPPWLWLSTLLLLRCAFW